MKVYKVSKALTDYDARKASGIRALAVYNLNEKGKPRFSHYQFVHPSETIPFNAAHIKQNPKGSKVSHHIVDPHTGKRHNWANQDWANAYLHAASQSKRVIVGGAKPASAKKKVAKSWQTKEGKNPNGGLNEKGRRSYERENPGSNLKPPVKSGNNPRRASFLARMGNMPGPERKPNGEPTRLLLSLQAWGASSKADAKKKAASLSAKNKVAKSYKDTIYFRDPQKNSKVQNIQREMLKNTAESAVVGGAIGYGRDQILRRVGPQFGMVAPPRQPKEPKTYKATNRRTPERVVREALDRRKGMPVPKNRPYRVTRRVMTAATKSNIKRGALFAGVAGLGGLYSGYKEGRDLPNRKNPRVSVAKFAAPIRHGVPAVRVRIGGLIGDLHTHTTNGVIRHTFYSLMTKRPENIDPTKTPVQILRQPKSFRAD